MRKIRHYKGNGQTLFDDSWTFHSTALARLDDGPKKTIIKDLEPELKSQYRLYADRFSSDKLEDLNPLDLNETKDFHPKKDALQYQYAFEKKKFVELYKQLSTDIRGRKSILCPNCQADDAHTLDHYLPKTDFPEFSDNPLNLILCCQDCNGKKGKRWRKDGKRIQLNLYLDNIPDVKYLYVTVNMVNGLPDATFEVKRPIGATDAIFDKIENHYSKLKLCSKKFVEKTYDALSELRSSLRPAYEKLSEAQAKESMMETVVEWKRKYGQNYWKAVLLEACGANPEVWTWFMTKEEDVNPQV